MTKGNKMKKLGAVFLVIVPLILPSTSWTGEKQEIAGRINEIKDTFSQDYRCFYSYENLRKLAIGIGIAGVLANTSTDREFRNWYQNSLRSKETDNLSNILRPFGDGMITIPVYLGAALFGEVTGDIEFGSTIGEWGKKSLRAILVGAPPMLLLQTAIGSSRPEEDDSYWQPFNDSNGVSGHSFVGAVPFMTGAKITDNPYLKYFLYVGSTLTGLSRVNDDAHYFSQVAVGWWLAYLAATCVDKAEKEKKEVVIAPSPIPNGVGFTVVFRF